MVGPSSSHTAGAVKIGYVSRKLIGEPIAEATINLYGSFLATGKGHGTRFAIVAGLLGMKLTFGEAELHDVHPNSAQLILKGVSGKELEVVGESVGGSLINIAQIDGIAANFSGDYRTLIVHNVDQPGHVAEVTSMLAHKSINIATMQLYRSSRGGEAAMVIECDKEVPAESIKWLAHLEGINKVTYYSLLN